MSLSHLISFSLSLSFFLSFFLSLSLSLFTLLPPLSHLHLHLVFGTVHFEFPCEHSITVKKSWEGDHDEISLPGSHWLHSLLCHWAHCTSNHRSCPYIFLLFDIDVFFCCCFFFIGGGDEVRFPASTGPAEWPSSIQFHAAGESSLDTAVTL